MNIGIMLKAVRENRGENQQDIANLLGTTQNYISRYESGKHDIPAYRLITLCKHWGVSADYILGLPIGLTYGKNKEYYNKGESTMNTEEIKEKIEAVLLWAEEQKHINAEQSTLLARNLFEAINDIES